MRNQNYHTNEMKSLELKHQNDIDNMFYNYYGNNLYNNYYYY